jgi:hypothetical protein
MGRGAGEFATRVLSSDGQRDGLYWPTGEGEPASPLGPLVAEAAKDGYTGSKSGERSPYHGYYYRLLTAQGPAAPGGALSYLSDGRLTGGFAVLAEPATYGNSGVMSFLVGPTGVVYERDLGPKTSEVAGTLVEFNPDAGWKVVAD